MPRLPVSNAQARDIVAYLLLWSKPSQLPAIEPPSGEGIQDTVRRLGDSRCTNRGRESAPREGLYFLSHRAWRFSAARRADPVRRCGLPGRQERPTLHADRRSTPEISRLSFRGTSREKYLSPYFTRQVKLARAGCTQCHQRDSDRLAPIEEAGSKLGGAFLEELPFLRTPRLTHVHERLMSGYIADNRARGIAGHAWATIQLSHAGIRNNRERIGSSARRSGWRIGFRSRSASIRDRTIPRSARYTVRGWRAFKDMPACRATSGTAGNWFRPIRSPLGPDLTRTAGRLRRDWFDRYLEDPLRHSPGTPMPSVFPHGKPATLSAILDGNAAETEGCALGILRARQGTPSPKPPPPVPVATPGPDEPVLVAQIPIRFTDGRVIESICLLERRRMICSSTIWRPAAHSAY